MPERCVRFVAGLLLLALLGCAVGPNYHAPAITTRPDWPQLATPAPVAATAPGEDLARWWTNFSDPKLNDLVARAIAENLDVKVAQLRILEARANKGITAAGFWPQANLNAQGLRARSALGATSNFFQHGFDATWELDFFGGTRRAVEAANANIDASIENERNVRVTLAAEVGTDYVAYCSLHEELQIARDNVAAQQKSLSLTDRLYKGGKVTMLDVANAQALVATTRAQIPVLEAAAQQTSYALAVLLGQEPAALDAELKTPASVPLEPPGIPVGLPSDLLRRRPDIRQAEALAHAATAQIGVAEAEWFPKFSLTGMAGFQGGKPASLVTWANRVWNFGPSMTWEGYAGGRIVSNVHLQKALRDESLATYRQTVLGALQDVDNALVAYAEEKEHFAALSDAVTANQKAVELSLKLYADGHTDFLNVLTAQRSLYQAQDALAQSRRSIATDVIALYKAIGGGWSEASPIAPEAESPPAVERTPAPNAAPAPGAE